MKQSMAELGDHVIGLWRYRVYGERRENICTFEINGDDFDSRQHVTPEAAPPQDNLLDVRIAAAENVLAGRRVNLAPE